MKQISFAEIEYQNKKHITRREHFLQKMEALIPWQRLEDCIRPYYPKPAKGRKPYPLQVMLRIHCLQLFYNLSDPGMEDSLYEIESMRRFAGLGYSDNIPDETTILHFRHLLEQHKLGNILLAEVNHHLEEQGVFLRYGSIVDATIITAPSSTKNRERQRDPAMRSTQKGKQWYFGMKAHIGVDAASGLIHSVAYTSANVHDVTTAHELLHGKEEMVLGDSGYRGLMKRDEMKRYSCSCLISRCRVKESARGSGNKTMWDAGYEKLKSSVRAKVEHPFRILKRQFGYDKVRYRGLEKNGNRISVLFALGNLLLGSQYLARQGRSAS